MDNVYEISLLMDFYGQLLTKKQYELLDLHYNNDYSLGEIAEEMDISRQGVYDNIRRAKNSLNDFEQKLGLVKKFSEQKKGVEKILESLQKFESGLENEKDKSELVKIKNDIERLIEQF